MNFSVNNNNNKEIPVLDKIQLYNIQQNEQKELFNISIKIDDFVYLSKNFNLLENNKYIELFSNENTNNKIIKCHFIKKPIQNKIDNIYLKIKKYSIQAYEYIFFFDYLINSRLTEQLWCSFSQKGTSVEENTDENKEKIGITPLRIGLLSLEKPDLYCSIRKDNSTWSKPFDINTIEVKGSIKLYMKGNNSMINGGKEINEVACIISSSTFYIYSIIVIFEPRYILINDLDFDIFYKQENIQKEADKIKKNSYCELKYQEGEKNIRIGILDQFSSLLNYSGIIDLDKINSFDTKIKISPQTKNLYPESTIFTYNGQEYYILIKVILHSYDNGLIYILFTNQLVPYLEIRNDTNSTLTVYEKSDINNKIIITNPNNISRFPFTYDNYISEDKTLVFEIYGIKKEFNFNDFSVNTITLGNNQNFLQYYVKAKNRNFTRIFTIKTRENIIKEFDKTFIERKTLTKSYVYDIFIKGFGISLIDKTPKEIFYISFYGITTRYSYNVLFNSNINKSIVTTNIELLFNNFQIDYCLNDSIKQIIYPKNQIIPLNINIEIKSKNENITPFLQLLVTIETYNYYKSNESFSKYSQIDFILQEFNFNIEQYALINLLNLINEYIALLNYTTLLQDNKEHKEAKLNIEYPIPIRKLINENQNASMMLIDYLLLSSLKFNLTLRLDLSNLFTMLPSEIMIVVGSVGNILTRITESPLNFREKRFTNIYSSMDGIMWKIINNYTAEGILQIYKILGSTDLIGNPIKLVENIGEGFYSFFDEPRKGFLLGPMDFGMGVAKGVGGLISGIVGGAFDVIGSITSSLYATTQSMMYSDKSNIIYNEDEPTDIFQGIFYGFIGAGKEIGKIFVTLFTIPCERAKLRGIKGFFSGLTHGLKGIVIFPCAAALKFVNSVTVGMKNSLYLLTGRKRLNTTRFRYPRVIIENDSIPIEIYEENKAEAKEILFKLTEKIVNNIIYAEDFICGDNYYDDKISICIITDEEVYIYYDMSKIIFNEKNKNIINCSVHFMLDRFIICLHLADNTKKGFSILKEYSRIVCFLYNYYCKKEQNNLIQIEGSNIIRSKTIKKLPHGYENDIDESNYDNTVSQGSQNSFTDYLSKK